MHLFDVLLSQELSELCFGQTSVADDSTHGEPVHGVVTWNGDDAFAVGHDDMLCTLASDAETGLFEGAYSPPMRYAGDAWHNCSDSNVDFTGFAAAKLLVNYSQIFADRVRDVG